MFSLAAELPCLLIFGIVSVVFCYNINSQPHPFLNPFCEWVRSFIGADMEEAALGRCSFELRLSFGLQELVLY